MWLNQKNLLDPMLNLLNQGLKITQLAISLSNEAKSPLFTVFCHLFRVCSGARQGRKFGKMDVDYWGNGEKQNST